MDKPLVAVIIGSKSDREKVQPCLDVLNELGVPWECSVISCHRHPSKLGDYLAEVINSKVKVVIAAAGMAAQLPGEVAATLRSAGIPVIGVALSSTNFSNAQDAVLSIIRMPPGVPLVCAGIDEAGAINAALFAANALVQAGELEMSTLLQLYMGMSREKPAEVRCETGPGKTEELG